MKKNLISPMALLIFLLILSSCKKAESDPKPSTLTPKTVTFDTQEWSKWVYFSFEKGTVVTIDDFSTSLEWDIGFHYFDVRVNCGTSGPGQGGSYLAGSVSFETLKEAPSSGYSLNDSIDIIEEFIIPPTFVTVPGDTIVSTWLTFTGPPPSYTLNDNIYVVKTANGKYAKIWLKDFFDDQSKDGFVKMQYVYQPDGSRNIE